MLTIWSDRLLTQRWKDFPIKHDLTSPLKIRRRINKRRNGQKARNRFPKQFEIPCLAWKLSFHWTAYTGTICYTKPPMSFSNQKKKKRNEVDCSTAWLGYPSLAGGVLYKAPFGLNPKASFCLLFLFLFRIRSWAAFSCFLISRSKDIFCSVNVLLSSTICKRSSACLSKGKKKCQNNQKEVTKLGNLLFSYLLHKERRYFPNRRNSIKIGICFLVPEKNSFCALY